MNLKIGHGFALLSAVGKTMSDQRLRSLLAKAIVVNIIVAILLIGLLVWLGTLLAGWILPESLQASAEPWMLIVLMSVLLLPTFPVLFVFVTSLTRPLFHGPMFYRARHLAGAVEQGSGGWRQEFASLVVDLRRIGRYLVFATVLLPINLVPGGTFIYAVLAFLLAAHTMAWDLLAYDFQHRRLSYREQKLVLKQNRLAVIWLGTIATLLCLIPVAQIVFVSTNVTGAGLVSADIASKSEDKSPPSDQLPATAAAN